MSSPFDNNTPRVEIGYGPRQSYSHLPKLPYTAKSENYVSTPFDNNTPRVEIGYGPRQSYSHLPKLPYTAKSENYVSTPFVNSRDKTNNKMKTRRIAAMVTAAICLVAAIFFAAAAFIPAITIPLAVKITAAVGGFVIAALCARVAKKNMPHSHGTELKSYKETLSDEEEDSLPIDASLGDRFYDTFDVRFKGVIDNF